MNEVDILLGKKFNSLGFEQKLKREHSEPHRLENVIDMNGARE
jgi:hypothetical protein